MCNSLLSFCALLLFLPPASPLLGSPLGRTRHSSSQSDLTTPPGTSSGLSFTACMSDFSLYVFHPYGAGKQKSAVTGLPPGPGPLGTENMMQSHPTNVSELQYICLMPSLYDCVDTILLINQKIRFQLLLKASSAGTVDEEPSSVTGRKDSLSINLEFVKVSLSRMRRTGGPTFIDSISAKGGKMDTTLINISGTPASLESTAAPVRPDADITHRFYTRQSQQEFRQRK